MPWNWCWPFAELWTVLILLVALNLLLIIRQLRKDNPEW